MIQHLLRRKLREHRMSERMYMKFCSKCGSYMKKTKNGFLCRKCGNIVHVRIQTKNTDVMERPSSIYIVDSSEDKYVKVSQTCPKCGNSEAFRWFSGVSGEHAGIRRERTIEHFRCTKCLHSWSKTS
jgi:DNA-directed RNA polymerase subunit M/transcription elongation factor TFIIS